MGSSRKKTSQFLVYIGTYTNRDSKGIYVSRFDVGSGKLSAPQLAAEAIHPNFLAMAPKGGFLYAVGEFGPSEKQKNGCVRAFSITPETGMLTSINTVSSGGAGPSHLALDKAGKCALAANYTSGTVAAFPIEADGRLSHATCVIQHTGSSVNGGRQEAPHPHSVTLDPDNRLAFVADLGLDKILVYRYDADGRTLTPHDPPSVSITPGSGPRHFAFGPTGRYAYLINEMANTITALAYDAARGVLVEIQTIATIPSTYRGETYTSEIQVHPSGKYLYGSNRGHHSIAIFEIAEKDGTLTLMDIQPCGGQWPRHFHIDPTGNWMLVGNEHSDSIVVFQLDRPTGRLTPTGKAVWAPSPVCIKFLAIADLRLW